MIYDCTVIEWNTKFDCRLPKSCSSTGHNHSTTESGFNTKTITSTRMSGASAKRFISTATCVASASAIAAGQAIIGVLQETSILAWSWCTIYIWVSLADGMFHFEANRRSRKIIVPIVSQLKLEGNKSNEWKRTVTMSHISCVVCSLPFITFVIHITFYVFASGIHAMIILKYSDKITCKSG